MTGTSNSSERVEPLMIHTLTMSLISVPLPGPSSISRHLEGLPAAIHRVISQIATSLVGVNHRMSFRTHLAEDLADLG